MYSATDGLNKKSRFKILTSCFEFHSRRMPLHLKSSPSRKTSSFESRLRFDNYTGRKHRGAKNKTLYACIYNEEEDNGKEKEGGKREGKHVCFCFFILCLFFCIHSFIIYSFVYFWRFCLLPKLCP